MTLAGLAYGAQPNIPGYLAADPLTGGDWSLDWIAQDQPTPDTFAFIARSASRGCFAIVIRGTYPNPLSAAYFYDANLDTPFGPMQPWPGASGAKISKGSWTAFQDIIALSDGSRTFAQAAAGIPAGATVYVTGHSLGGTMAQVIGLWLSQQPGAAVPWVCAFAGMTPGNAAFAKLFGPGSPLGDRVFRYNNTLDTVGYGWDRVWATHDFYKPAPQGGILVAAAIGVTAIILLFYGFRSIGAEVKLKGSVQPPQIKITLLAYVAETLRQHLPDTYLQLLGAPPLPFTLGFGAVVAPPEGNENAHLWIRKRRPFYLTSSGAG